MNRSILLFVPLLTACGSVVIVAGDPRADAAVPDVAVTDGTVPSDAVTPPPPLDVNVVEATPPPPPPGALAQACQRFCQRGNAVCRTNTDCATLCRDALSDSLTSRCPAEALAMLTCAVNRNAFQCRPMGNSFNIDRGICVTESMALDRCAASQPPPPPPPPEDAGVDLLAAACLQVCDRQARDCGTEARACVDQCLTVRSAPNYDLCRGPVVALYTCVARNGFTCGPMGMNQPAAACRAIGREAGACLNGPTDPPPPDDAGPAPDDASAPLYRGCVDACAVADRACGTSDPSCAPECSSAAAMLSGACLRTFDELMTCVQRNGFTCRSGSPEPSSACNAILMRLEMCSGGGGSLPPTVDAGAPDA